MAAPASSTRRLLARAALVLGAVLVGGQVMRALPREQTLIFPVGSVFPNATRFTASWREIGDQEPRGGVSLTFEEPPPLQIRQHAKLPDGDYIVSIDISQAPRTDRHAESSANGQNRAGRDTGHALQAGETSGSREGVETNIERRVSLAGGEALIALAAVPR